MGDAEVQSFAAGEQDNSSSGTSHTAGGFTFSESSCKKSATSVFEQNAKKRSRGRPQGSLNAKGTSTRQPAADRQHHQQPQQHPQQKVSGDHINFFAADETGEIFPQQETPTQGEHEVDWKSQSRIPDSNLIPGTLRETPLIDIPFQQLALNALGKPLDIVPPRSIRVLFLAFNHVLREISDNPREENGYKKWAILPSILFIDSGKNNNVNIVNKVNLILADDYSKFTVGSFPGKFKEAAVHVTSEKEGTENEKHRFIQQKLFSCRKYIQKGEVGRAWRAWDSERASTAASEEGLEALKKKIIDRDEQHTERELIGEEVVGVTATSAGVQSALLQLAKGVRPGHDNLSADILQEMLRYSLRRGTDPIVSEFLELYANFLNNVFLNRICPPQVTEFFDGGEIFGLTTLKKSNRPITMVSTHRKIADKILLASIRLKCPKVFTGLQYGVGCPFGLEKLVHFVRLGHELYPGHDCANSDMTNAFSSISREQIIDATQAHFPEISASTSARLQSSNTLWYNGLDSGPASITAKTGVPQGAPKSPFDFAVGTLALGRHSDSLAGEEGNSKSYLDDNYTIGECKNVQAVISNQRQEGAAIGLQLNMQKEIVKLGRTGSSSKALERKQSYVDGWEIDPDNIFVHPSDIPAEAERWGAITMGIPIGSPEYVQRTLLESESSPLAILNKEFDSLLELAALDPQLAFLFLKLVFSGKLTHFLRGLLPADSKGLAEIYLLRQREVLQVILDVDDMSESSYDLSKLGLLQGGAGLCSPLDMISPAFVASIVASMSELQIAYPEIKDILADGQSSLPTVKAFHTAVAELTAIDKHLTVKNLLKVETRQIPKLQHILYRKVRESRRREFLASIEEDKEALVIVQSGSTSFGSAWVEAVPKTAAFVMAPPEFRTAMRNRLLVPHPQILPHMQCKCKAKEVVDVRGIHLQKCKLYATETNKTHDLLNLDLIEFHKCMGLLAYKIKEDHFRIADPTCGLRADQIVYRPGQMPLVIDVTVSNAVTPDIKKKGKPTAGVMARKREDVKILKYQAACVAIGQSFMPAAFESQGCAGDRFLRHFDQLVSKRADQIGAPVAALAIYWSRRLSLTLQRNVAQAINFRLMTLYAGPVGHAATDETVWTGVMASQAQTSVGTTGWDR
jgi:hypothetical protein